MPFHSEGADNATESLGREKEPPSIDLYTSAASVRSDGSGTGQLTVVNSFEDIPGHDEDTVDKEIEYRYLDFDTEIPTTPIAPASAESALPPCPNLHKYDNPFAWPRQRKYVLTGICCAVNCTAAYASGSYASPETQLTDKWGISHVVYTLGITVFTFGFGIAPMVLAPFSEINGRKPVFVVTGILFVICQLGAAVTDSFAGMLLSRWWMGVGGSTFSTMSGGILADIWVASERNTAMVLFTGATLFGTGLGPLVSGFVAQRLLWRWVFYIQIITSGVLVAFVALFFKETRGNIVLSKKARAVNKWYEKLERAGASGLEVPSSDPEKGHIRCQRIRFKVKADEERASIAKMIGVSLYRPIHMLLTEPVVFWFSLWVAFAWAILYLQFGSVPLVFEVSYGFSLEQTGLIFIAMCVGAIISTWLSIYQEKWAVKRYPEKMKSPEGRLLFTCFEAALVPIGLFWFGWTCYPSIHWIVPAIAVGVATMGIFSVFLAVFNYSADVYGIYASSALAASGLCRNLLGGAFPLVTHQLFNNLGFQAASSLLGGIAAALTLVPWVLVAFGPKIRARSKIASAFVQQAG